MAREGPGARNDRLSCGSSCASLFLKGKRTAPNERPETDFAFGKAAGIPQWRCLFTAKRLTFLHL